jgi:Tfp pilus assembly protein PilN
MTREMLESNILFLVGGDKGKQSEALFSIALYTFELQKENEQRISELEKENEGLKADIEELKIPKSRKEK